MSSREEGAVSQERSTDGWCVHASCNVWIVWKATQLTMRSEAACELGRNFSMSGMHIKVAVKFSQGPSSVQCDISVYRRWESNCFINR
jgi:hypothetical protein